MRKVGSGPAVPTELRLFPPSAAFSKVSEGLPLRFLLQSACGRTLSKTSSLALCVPYSLQQPLLVFPPRCTLFEPIDQHTNEQIFLAEI